MSGLLNHCRCCDLKISRIQLKAIGERTGSIENHSKYSKHRIGRTHGWRITEELIASCRPLIDPDLFARLCDPNSSNTIYLHASEKFLCFDFVPHYVNNSEEKQCSKRLELLCNFFDIPEEFVQTTYAPNIDTRSRWYIPTRAESELNVIVKKLYEKLRDAHLRNDGYEMDEIYVQSEHMNSKLTPYQIDAVRWMLKRELCSDSYKNEWIPIPLKFDIPKDSYRCNRVKGDSLYFYFCPRTYDFAVSSVEWNLSDYKIPSGGILADEMGLGKTVELLALILKNRRPIEDFESETNHAESSENKEFANGGVEESTEIGGLESDDEPLSKKVKKSETINLVCFCTSQSNKKLITCIKCALSQHRKCVLTHCEMTDDTEKDYICPSCWQFEDVSVSGATLIVTPPSIKKQWMDEVKKHITDNGLKAVIYDGYQRFGWISPKELAKYDLIIADFNGLGGELNLVEAAQAKRTSRHALKYLKPICPLQKINFWRICIDEAQIIESGLTRSARLLEHLKSTHRWAITGTPIDKAIEDLQGLFNFLNCEPYNNKAIWQCLDGIGEQFARGQNDCLVDVLQRIMWRTCKTPEIISQASIPKQNEIVHWVTMSDLETYFYQIEFNKCADALSAKVNDMHKDFGDEYSLRKLQPQTLNSLMEPLRKLRQDCSVPSVFAKHGAGTKNCVKPDQLLEHLISNVEIQAKSELRSIVSAMNGLAALFIVKENVEAAIKKYQSVLQLAKERTKVITVDSLLQIHALHNMILVDKTLGDEQKSKYQIELREMEMRFIETNTKLIAKKRVEVDKFKTEIQKLRKEFNYDEYHWWLAIFELHSRDSDQMLSVINKILVEVQGQYGEALEVRSSDGLSMMLTSWIDKLIKERENVFKMIKKLSFFINNLKPMSSLEPELQKKIKRLIDDALECHLDPNETRISKQTKRKDFQCELCLAKVQLDTYECVIFNKKLTMRGATEGSWKPSSQETILSTLVASTRRWNIDQETREDAKTHLKLFECLRNEFKELSQFWVEVNYAASVFDEISMCKMRLQIVDPEEMEENIKSNLCISKYDINDTIDELEDQLNQSNLDFVRATGRLKYLNHLKNKNETQDCPACQQQPQEKYVVFECGHHSCIVCFDRWSKMTPGLKLKCMICRHEQQKKSIQYVTLHTGERLTDSSSKIEEIVRTVVELKKNDEKVKIVIFSHWPTILEFVETALIDNKIECRSKMTKFAETLSDFKSIEKNVTCLLLPLKAGSKGLNLTEASHVFLIEPILNPGEELQAIGRIHRIGQSKESFAHRFIVKETIEEHIYSKCKEKDWTYEDWTFTNLMEMFRK